MSTRNNVATRGESPWLCYVTDRRSLPVRNPADSLTALTAKIEEIACAGIDWIQIREKDLSARELASLTRQALDIAAKSYANRARAIRILVNDRLDVAVAERADGAHLGESSVPPGEAKRLIQSAKAKGAVAEDFLLGVSCHSLDAAKAAEAAGADYIFFGPIFATPSKEAFGAPQGIERLGEVCRSVSIPVLAIGGITLDHGKSCVEAGASGLAAIRLFQDAHQLSKLIRFLNP